MKKWIGARSASKEQPPNRRNTITKEQHMSTLQGKVALVTGGSRGIGAAIAKRLAPDGADVAITYVSSPDKARAVVAEIEKLGRRGLAIQADSADAAAVDGAVDKTAAELGRLDILVNNAGMFVAVEVRRRFAARTWTDSGPSTCEPRSSPFKPRFATCSDGGRIITIGSCVAERVAGARRHALRHDQGGRRRPHPRPRSRPRPARNHRQRRRAGPDRHRHEPGHR